MNQTASSTSNLQQKQLKLVIVQCTLCLLTISIIIGNIAKFHSRKLPALQYLFLLTMYLDMYWRTKTDPQFPNRHSTYFQIVTFINMFLLTSIISFSPRLEDSVWVAFQVVDVGILLAVFARYAYRTQRIGRLETSMRHHLPNVQQMGYGVKIEADQGKPTSEEVITQTSGPTTNQPIFHRP